MSLQHHDEQIEQARHIAAQGDEAGFNAEQIREARSLVYRSEIRHTLQGMSDKALAYQALVIVGGIDREELEREQARRARGC